MPFLPKGSASPMKIQQKKGAGRKTYHGYFYLFFRSVQQLFLFTMLFPICYHRISLLVGGNFMFQIGDKAGLVACSNALSISRRSSIQQLVEILSNMGLTPVFHGPIYTQTPSVQPAPDIRANALMECYRTPEIRAIFDLSGGDIANGILEYLDFDLIRSHPKPLFGYSDLTTVLNAVTSQTGMPSYLYQIQNLVGKQGPQQIDWFGRTLFDGHADLFTFSTHFLQGTQMEGPMVGGNIRCFLKLAGTPYFPALSGKILFLEANSGRPPQMAAYLHQLRQMGAFQQVSGILLGTFTQMEEQRLSPTMEELVLSIVQQPALPIAITTQIGHGAGSNCLKLVELYVLIA